VIRLVMNIHDMTGVFDNAPLGNVFAADEDDWDVTNKTFTFVDRDARILFRSAVDATQCPC